MLTGHLPFAGPTSWALMEAVLAEEPVPVGPRRPDTPPELEGLIAAALKKDRAARALTADQAASELSLSLARISSPQLSAMAPPPLMARPLRTRVLVPAAALLVAAVAAAGWWIDRTSKMRWAREYAVPTIIQRPIDLAYTLDRAGDTPPGTVRVSAGEPFSVFIPGLDHLPPVEIRDWDEHPVTGVSWYEAAAYAGKTLPTIFHWSRAAE